MMRDDEAIGAAVETLADAISSSMVYIYGDLVSGGLLTKENAAERMRGYARHMRSEEHRSPAIGAAVALKVEELASIFEAVGTASN